MKNFKITNKDVAQLLGAEEQSFPKYATQILNLANQNAQGTRPSVVGKLSELIDMFQGYELNKWEQWYLGQHPDAIQQATSRVIDMLNKFKQVIATIDEEMVTRWVSDLVIVKSFLGLRIQAAILQKIAEDFSVSYRIASPQDESKGIDGWIGNQPVSVKPSSYNSQKMILPENISIPIIIYEKLKNGFMISFDENLIRP